jgi:type I restriction enzyme S subunit
MTDTRPLSSLCEFIVDCEHKTAPLAETGYPSIRTPNVGRGRLILEGVNRVSEETYRAWTKRAVPEVGDLIIAREAPVGNVAIVPPGLHVCLGQRTVLVRPDKKQVDPQYLCYFLLGDYAQHKFRGASVGATVAHLNMKDIRGLPMPALPPLPTQRRIASILGAYDDLIEVNRRRIAVLEEMARGLFEEWFVRFRFPGHEAVPILDTPDGPLPEGWTWGVFGDLAREVRQTVSPDDLHPDTPYVGLEHMPRRSFTLDQHGQAEEVSSLKSHFQRGDILFGKIRPYFHKVIWAGFDGVSSTDAIVWRPVAGLAAQALATASSDAFVAYSVQTSNGTKMPRANTRVLAEYRCTLAPSDISSRFEDAVSPMVELCATLQAGSRRLATSRDLLLPRLISGQLSVAEAERELEEAA